MLPALLKRTEREHKEKKEKVARLQKFYSKKQVSIATKVQKCINTILQEKGRMAQKNKIGIELYTLGKKTFKAVTPSSEICVQKQILVVQTHRGRDTLGHNASGTASEDRIPAALLNAKREDFWAIGDYFQALKSDRILLLGFELAWDQ